MFNKIINTGPKIFLQRLKESGTDLTNIALLNPSIDEYKNYKKDNRILVGRLDGTSYYDFTKENLSNFLNLREFNKLSKLISVLPKINSNKYINQLLNRYLDRTSNWLLQNAEGLIFQSQISLEMHRKFLGFCENKPFKIINNGVDLDYFRPNKNKQSNSFGSPSLIVSASLFRLHKRLKDTIKLTNSLSKIYPKIKLNILGELDKLTKISILNLDCSNCIFHGRVNAIKLNEYYNKCDMQIHLSIFDPCPNVVVEGLASGLPVITLKESGAFELIGIENSNWSIKENIEMDYLELHTDKKIPTIPQDKYKDIIIEVYDNINYNKELARFRAEKCLDIKKISTQYNDFFN